MRDLNKKNIKLLSMSAISLALSVLFLIMFRGPISILSTFIIPPIIVLFSLNNDLRYYVLTSLGLIIISSIFFPTQIVFVTLYILLAFFIRFLFFNNKNELKIKVPSVITYIILVMISLYLGIRITQIIFLVPLHTMMLRLSGGNPINYIGILIIEAIITVSVNIIFLRVFFSRIDTYKR